MVILVPDDNQCTYWELDDETADVVCAGHPVLFLLWLCRDCVHGCHSVPWTSAGWGLLDSLKIIFGNLLTVSASGRNIPVSDN